MGKRLKVGLLLEARALFAWERAMLERIAASDYAEIVLNVRFTAPPDADAREQRHSLEPAPRRAARRTARALQAIIDGKVGGCVPYAFEVEPDDAPVLRSIPVLDIEVGHSPMGLVAAARDIERLGSFEIDVLIDMSSHGFHGDLLRVPRFGVWSQPHVNQDMDPLVAFGFWEVFHGRPVTALTVRARGPDGGDKVLGRTFSRTCTVSVKRNRNDLHWKTSLQIPRKLRQLHLLGPETFFARCAAEDEQRSVGSNDARATPELPHEIALALRLFWRVYSRRIRNLFVSSRWIILSGRRDRRAPWLSTFEKISPPKDRLWADPHVLFRNRTYHMFLEEVLFCRRKGHISVMELQDDGSHTMARPVIEEPYHLSNPFVFEHAGEIFLIPESSANRSVDLYRCVSFPDRWERCVTLLENVDAVDTTLYFHRGKWWLFTCIREHEGDAGHDDLFLFHADDFRSGRWEAHPLNPVVSDVTRARPAGDLFEHEGKLYRPAQDCSIRYGYGIRIQEVLELSEADYREREAAFIPPNRGEQIVATHTMSTAGNVVLSDALEEKWCLFSRIPRAT
jgi:hypothetical protein